MTRFCTGGMSLGAISRETHETIAIAMNRIGGVHPSSSAVSQMHPLLQLLSCALRSWYTTTPM